MPSTFVSSNTTASTPEMQTEWRQSLADFDSAYQAYSETEQGRALGMPATMTPPTVSAKSSTRPLVSKRDLRVLLLVRQILLQHDRDESSAGRVQQVVRIDPAGLRHNPNSLPNRVYEIVRQAGMEGIHITDILARLEQLKQSPRSEHHRYQIVRKALTQNSAVICRSGKGRFRLRNGLLPGQRVATTARKAPVVADSKLPSLIDIARKQIEKFRDHPLAPLSARQVWGILMRMGYRCSYDYLRQALIRAGIRTPRLARKIIPDESSAEA